MQRTAIASINSTRSRRSWAKPRRICVPISARSNQALERGVPDRPADLMRGTAEAERANQTKSRFLAAVSHDLMQPLHAAQLFAHTIAAQGPVTAQTDTPKHLLGALAAT